MEDIIIMQTTEDDDEQQEMAGWLRWALSTGPASPPSEHV